MMTIDCKVHSETGLTARMCAELVAEANRATKCTLLVTKDSDTADLKSIMNMMSLIIKHDEEFTIIIDGPDAKAVNDKFINLLTNLNLLK